MMRTLIALVATIVGISVVAAQNETIAIQRQKLMKENSDDRGVLNRMLRNQAPYDQAAVDATLKKMIANSKRIPSVFTPDSYKGPDPKYRYYAMATGLQKQAEIKEKSASLEKALIAAQGKITDLNSLKATWTPINENFCEGCHSGYRARRE
jgi:cytochrome c556